MMFNVSLWNSIRCEIGFTRPAALDGQPARAGEKILLRVALGLAPFGGKRHNISTHACFIGDISTTKP